MFANNKNYFLISSSFILTYAIYLVSIQVSKIYPTLVVPSGDPFSYEVSLINLYNYSTFSVSNYFKGIIDTITSGQWYYAYKLPIALFSPFLTSNHYDLLIVNYFYLLILILIIQITLSYINKNNIVNLLSLIVIFLFPYLWGYKSIISINQLSLDTQVFLVSISYFFLLVSYYHKYSSTKLSILVSILGGFLFWTRGNAFTFFIILTIPTFLLFFLRFLKFNSIKKIRFLKKLIIPILIFTIIVGWIYLHTFQSILHYYSSQTNAFDTSKISPLEFIKATKIILLNYPGAFFTNISFHEFSLKNLFFTLTFYLFNFFMFFFYKYKSKTNMKIKKKYNLIKVCFITILFTKPFEFYGVPFFANGIAVPQIMYLPLVPFYMIVVIVNVDIWNFFKNNINNLYYILLSISYLIIVSAFILIISFVNTNFVTPKKVNDDDSFFYMKRLANPYELEKLSLDLGYNSKVYTLLYNFYNPAIISYYRLKNKFPPILINYDLESDIIAPFINNPEIRGGPKKFKESLIKIFYDADIIILPKNLDDYKNFKNVIVSQYYEIFYDVLSQENIPKFRVVKELNDTIDLVLLKRTNDNKYDIYDGKKTFYKNSNQEIDLFAIQNKNLWFKFTTLNQFTDFFKKSFIKKLLYGENDKNFKLMLDLNNNSFFEKSGNKISFLLTSNSENILNNISVFTEDRSNKNKENIHHGSQKIKAEKISIYGSNDLAKWSIIENEINLIYDKEGLSKTKINKNNSFTYYLIQLLSNHSSAIRVYDIFINEVSNNDWKFKFLEDE